jgi:hypothetical protein
LFVGLLIKQIVDFDIDGAVAQAKIGRPSKVMLYPLRIALPPLFDLSARPPSGKLSLQAGV